MPPVTQHVRLPGGRVLAYDDHGPLDGLPLVYFHGAPSARIEPQLFKLPAVAQRLGIRLIAPDRPGVGRSDFVPGRRMSDWPADVAALADHLGLRRFAVLGYSGGGPYALACALALPARLSAVGVVSGAGPYDVPDLTEGIAPESYRYTRLSVEKPRLHVVVSGLMALVARVAPGRMAAQAIAALPEPDARLMAQPGAGHLFARLVAEAAGRRPRGAQWDTALMVSPWEFDPAAITLPVYLWYGEQDRNVPIATARYLAARIPRAHLTTFPEDGHLSALGRHAQTILGTLARVARGEGSDTAGGAVEAQQPHPAQLPGRT